MKNKRFARRSLIFKTEEEHLQVEKLNHWRHNASAQSPRVNRKYTFRRKLSVTTDPSSIVNISMNEFQNERKKQMENEQQKIFNSILSEERSKNKKNKDEYVILAQKNNDCIQNTTNNYKNLSIEIEKMENQIKKIKQDIEEMKKNWEKVVITHDTKQKELQNQEMLLFATKNSSKKNKQGETNESIIIKEKIRNQKQILLTEFMSYKEKYLYLLEEKNKDKENCIINKRELKKEQEATRTDLISIYMKILRQGLDVREEGLKWVIKCLWELEESIPLSIFPKFLDEESSQFILSIAKLDLELTEYYARLQNTRSKLKEEKSYNWTPKTTNSLLSDVKDRIKKITCSAKAHPVGDDKNTIVIENLEGVPENNNYVNEITWIKENIDRINKVTTSLSKKEINRVALIYKHNPSEVGLGHIFRALIGVKAREYINFTQI
jgi:hypothetical protein